MISARSPNIGRSMIPTSLKASTTLIFPSEAEINRQSP